MSTEHKQIHLITFDLEKEIAHGIQVSNLAYRTGKQMGLSEEICHELAIAGILHDIGKLKLFGYIAGDENPLVVEEIKYVRKHPQLGYESLKDRAYSRFILESIYYHHENYDGSGYPENLRGKEIPEGARILRVCDVFAALTSKRSYRDAFSTETAVEMMIDEVKNFDMKVFLAFQRAIHEL
ncbi:MAG: HD-GYP domain-containing protein [Blautia sp.]